ncbi:MULTISPECIES: flagellar biosynthetic protein FliO [Caballeronia]|jgi:flagellar protein FliO/FliZ|uniref:Flagellar protein n=1 Tax=Caballeronia zhejiangensis TaxID=871203 RepID=A0A656QEL9_9BURK|nr:MULTISPECIES: flagellar biosynthetic protein FliO [Caballeronia]EKS69284.1 flagellar biosynthetic protein FliO [Burkholderia sp. SJ98]KDR27351.1 flagellar biosynthesis protein FliO [Caballeronia zhejiangensis]MCG7405279.1 flagellar biosynthetic protein FliO [Caballeronia zhejiangensis]MCI1047361.1 flagellar biosynthetic protein FliO [Caballeronia zhejiangensis]MDR5763649.1 flagellar biosynthetic protein FliO [Caballeronia sp. LZ028]
MKRLAVALLFAAPLFAHAADMNAVNHAAQIASGVGAGTAVPSLGFGAVLQTLLGLVIVIGFVFGCAWLARKFGYQGGKRSGLVKVVGGASLGNKERVAVVEVGDTWLVLGAGPGNVRLLHTMPAGSAEVEGVGVPAQSSPPAGNFGQRFRDALAGEANKRLQKFVSPGK